MAGMTEIRRYVLPLITFALGLVVGFFFAPLRSDTQLEALRIEVGSQAFNTFAVSD